jgi:hypothetical protein
MNDYVQEKYGDSAEKAAKAKLNTLNKLNDALFTKGEQLGIPYGQLCILQEAIQASVE